MRVDYHLHNLMFSPPLITALHAIASSLPFSDNNTLPLQQHFTLSNNASPSNTRSLSNTRSHSNIRSPSNSLISSLSFPLSFSPTLSPLYTLSFQTISLPTSFSKTPRENRRVTGSLQILPSSKSLSFSSIHFIFAFYAGLPSRDHFCVSLQSLVEVVLGKPAWCRRFIYFLVSNLVR